MINPMTSPAARPVRRTPIPGALVDTRHHAIHADRGRSSAMSAGTLMAAAIARLLTDAATMSDIGATGLQGADPVERSTAARTVDQP
jgi:hypothetical protein